MDDNIIDLDLARIEKEIDYIAALADYQVETFEILQKVVKLEPTQDNIDLIIRTRKLIRAVKDIK